MKISHVWLEAAILFVLAGVAASASARVVTATSDWSSGASASMACSSAKRNARDQASNREEVTGYSRCECEQKSSGWYCSVDARIDKKAD